MAYEIFKRTGARVDTPMLAITPDGRMTINSAAVRISRDSRIEAVLLLWDWTHHRLAIKAAHKGDKDSYALSIASHSGSLRAKSFLGYIGWRARKRVSISMGWNDKERMFEAQLPVEHLESERWGLKRSKGD
jgi:hypothetical protein